VMDVAHHCTQLAIQGPKADDLLRKLTNADLSKVKNYWYPFGTVCGLRDTMIARTGYTAEDGFEIYIPSDEKTSEEVWNQVMEAGKDFGILPRGLGARTTFRRGRKIALYGHDVSAHITVFARARRRE